MQDCSNSNANALELLQSCTKPSLRSGSEVLKNQVQLLAQILRRKCFYNKTQRRGTGAKVYRAIWSGSRLQACTQWGCLFPGSCRDLIAHYRDVIMSAMASQITSVSIVCSTICSGADQRKHESSALLALCEGNPPVSGGFPSQRANNAENVPI